MTTNGRDNTEGLPHEDAYIKKSDTDETWEVHASDGAVTHWNTEQAAELHAKKLKNPETAGNAAVETTETLRAKHREQMEEDKDSLEEV